MHRRNGTLTRRQFLRSAAATAALAGFPTIVPARVLGQFAPSKQVNVGAIGAGRISRVHDMPNVLKLQNARIVAVCDLYAPRVTQGKQFVNDFYAKRNGSTYDGTLGYSSYHELLANKDIDAVLISTPDHQHAIIACAAVRAGKDVYLQKPASLTIAEGRHLSNTVQSSGRILQVGSQQRAWKQFHRACELVRNGRIGEVRHVEIGLPGDPAGGNPKPMPVPEGFQYDAARPGHADHRLRPPRLAAHGTVRRRHDHRMGRAPHRHRALGHEYRVHRSGRDLGQRRVPHQRLMGCAR
jgi:hypothetical protein